ncbi:MAG: pyridoxamine 5'-phosphate oxidase family protein [Bacillota bacterium]
MSEIMGKSLNSAVMDLFEKKIATGILATVNQDATPHTSPMNLMVAPDPKHIYLAIARNSQTLANIRLHEPAALALLDEGNIAVCIKGLAKVIKENMDANYNLAVIALGVAEVKNDASPQFLVVQGVRTRHSSETGLLSIKKVFTELLSLYRTGD